MFGWSPEDVPGPGMRSVSQATENERLAAACYHTSRSCFICETLPLFIFLVLFNTPVQQHRYDVCALVVNNIFKIFLFLFINFKMY